MTLPPFEQGIALSILPGIRHGFFGRKGADGDTLDVSETLGTPQEQVAANRAMAISAIGAGTRPLAGLSQQHTNKVLTLEDYPDPAARPAVDGVVTALPDLVLGIVTADCAPILFADARAGVIGACHAGWRGAADGIVGNTVDAMVMAGASRSGISAAIGPTISLENYEVGADFARTLGERTPHARPFLRMPPGRTTMHFDLPGFLLKELEAAGVGTAEPAFACTYADPDRYFSHRHFTHHGGTPGRQIALIARITE